MGDTIKDDGSHKSWVAVVERAEAAECALSVRNAQIARLRAELARITAIANEARAVMREVRVAWDAAVEQRDAARAERDAARRERDERPAISRSDAAAWLKVVNRSGITEGEYAAYNRVDEALRAHAARATNGDE